MNNHWMRGMALLGLMTATVSAAELNGELDWANRVVLSVPLSGRVERLDVQAGQPVDAGQLLLQLDTRNARAHLTQARSTVRRLELQRAEAQREWDRAKELYDRTVLSERELQLAEIGFASADADYQVARAALVAAEVALENHSLKAPAAAWVLATHVTPGEAVVGEQQAMPLVTLAERGRMRARAAVNAAQAAAVRAGASATVQVGEQRFDAQVVRIGVDPLSGERPALYPLEVEFSVPADSALRAGQTATLVLP